MRGRAALMKKDAVLARHIDHVGPLRLELKPLSSIYEALAEAIVYQQLSGKAAGTIWGRAATLGKRGFPTPDELVALPEETVRAAGISSAKQRALRDLAAHAARGELPTVKEAAAIDDDDLVERLTIVRGVGRWTVEMLLIFRLGRSDVLPATDYGVRKGFQKVFRTRELPDPDDILQRGERWRPHRTIASWYLWRALDTQP